MRFFFWLLVPGSFFHGRDHRETISCHNGGIATWWRKRTTEETEEEKREEKTTGTRATDGTHVSRVCRSSRHILPAVITRTCALRIYITFYTTPNHLRARVCTYAGRTRACIRVREYRPHKRRGRRNRGKRKKKKIYIYIYIYIYTYIYTLRVYIYIRTR